MTKVCPKQSKWLSHFLENETLMTSFIFSQRKKNPNHPPQSQCKPKAKHSNNAGVKGKNEDTGLPAGKLGLLGLAEGLSFLAIVAGVVVLGLQVTNYGYIPNAVPTEGGICQ